MPVLLDKEIDEKYEVLELMAVGGMGAVYKVRHRLLDEICVIKTAKHVDKDAETRFVSEARRGRQLDHRNIARVFDFDVTKQGTAYIVMEYIDGMNLRQVLNSKILLPVSRVIEIVLETLDALQYLHDRLFVHRDISPENVMLAKDGRRKQIVKLIDLGIAKSLEHSQSLTADGKFIGKFKYAAPEQFSGDADPRSDLYALAIVMYELLTGVAPFKKDDQRVILNTHMNGDFVPFDKTDPNRRVPAKLREIVMHALRTEPVDRFPSANAFSTALHELGEIEERVPEPTVVVDVQKLLAEDTPARPAAEVKEVSDTLEVVGVTERQRERIEEDAWQKALAANTIETWREYLSVPRPEAHRTEAEQQLGILLEDADWKLAAGTGTSDAWRVYLNAWSDSARSGDAKQRLADALQREAEELAWDEAVAANTTAAFQLFLDRHPRTARADEARERLRAVQFEADEEIAWRDATREDSSASWNAYLERFGGSKRGDVARTFLAAAVAREDEKTAYAAADAVDTSTAWREFLKKWPKSDRADEAGRRLRRIEAEQRAWTNAIDAGTSAEWNRYLAQYGYSERADLALRNLGVAQDFEKASEQNSIDGWTTFLAAHADSQYAGTAQQRLTEAQERENEQRAWSEAERVNTSESWHVFTMRHPRSPRIDEANKRLARATMTEARDAALHSGTVENLRAFRKRFPGSEYDAEIVQALQAKEAEERAWKRASSSKDVDALARFIGEYASSPHVPEAQQRIAEIQKRRDEQERLAKEARAKEAAELEKKREEQARRLKAARDEALQAGTTTALTGFLRKYPRSEYESQIRAALQARENAEVEKRREAQALRIRNARDEALQAGTITALASFLRKYPRSDFETEIRTTLQAKETAELEKKREAQARRLKDARDEALQADNIPAFYSFLRRHPHSEYEAEIRVALQAKETAELERQREVEALHIRVARDEALHIGTVDALTRFLRRHPGSPYEQEITATLGAKKNAEQTTKQETAQRRRITTRAFAGGLAAAVILGVLIYLKPPPPAPLNPPVVASTGPAQATTSTPPAVTTMAAIPLPPPPSTDSGQILINASPWGEVKSVRDERNVEHVTERPLYTPAKMTLPVGRYVVQLSNPNSNKTAQCVVTVASGQIVKCERPLDTFNSSEYLGHLADSQ